MTEREEDYDYGYYDQQMGSVTQLTEHAHKRVKKPEPMGFRVTKKGTKRMPLGQAMYEAEIARGRNPFEDERAQSNIFRNVSAELERASKWPPFNSAHEGYGVLLEEMDELKAHVWMRQDKRDLTAMRAEAIQVAAMAIKFVEMIDAGRGRV